MVLHAFQVCALQREFTDPYKCSLFLIETDITITNVFVPQAVVYSVLVVPNKKGPWNCFVQAY